MQKYRRWMPVCVLYLLFSHNSMFIQGGRGRWGVISGWFETHRRRWLLGRSEGISGCFGTHRRLWYIDQGELTGAGDFGEDIIVLTLLNPPVPVTLGDLEERDKIVSFDKRKVCINPTNTTYFCWHFHSIFAQTYFLFAFVEKKHVAVGLIGNKFSRQFRKNMWFSKSPAPVTCIIIYVFATGECTG